VKDQEREFVTNDSVGTLSKAVVDAKVILQKKCIRVERGGKGRKCKRFPAFCLHKVDLNTVTTQEHSV
jgi:hypothetical protein